MKNVERAWRCFLLSVLFLSSGQAVLAQTASPPKKDPQVLVVRISNASLDELRKLSFLELNTLKNAIYASKGYRFADDRPWLQELFCPEVRAARLAENQDEDGEGEGSAPRVPDAQELEFYGRMRAQTKWNLDDYAFPGCREGGPLDEEQKKALANIRVATFKKIAGIGNINEVDADYLDREMTSKTYVNLSTWVLGKPLELRFYESGAQVSILRDVHGYAQLLRMINDVERDVDPMELLGLYAGDIVFLRNVIEAKYGKPISGVLGWEIAQLIGIQEKKQNYDPSKLPARIQVKLQMLDGIVQKIMQSDLNDIPKALKNEPVDVNFDPYRSGAC